MVGLALAIPTTLITIIRLSVHARARNLGLDDVFATSSLVGLVVLYVFIFLYLDPHCTPPPHLILLSHLHRSIFLPVLTHFFFLLDYCLRGVAYIRHHFSQLNSRAPMPANLRVTAGTADGIRHTIQHGNVVSQCTLLSRYAGARTEF